LVSLCMSSGGHLVTLDKSCCLLCAGEELLPLFDEVDEGCQWDVQIDEGWTPYWDPHALSTDGWHSLLGRRECSERVINHFRKLCFIL
jgi:hypothetical protein